MIENGLAGTAIRPFTEAEKERYRRLTMDILGAWAELRELAAPRAVVCLMHRKGNQYGPQSTLCPICSITRSIRQLPHKADLEMWPDKKKRG